MCPFSATDTQSGPVSGNCSTCVGSELSNAGHLLTMDAIPATRTHALSHGVYLRTRAGPRGGVGGRRKGRLSNTDIY